ncbi:DUF726-domain-containing protein [Amylostereum chailletii]|nr:DUF726-domain-containing protein [Amylostereum chailletii]
MGDLTKLAPPADLSETERDTIFYHIYRRLAGHRHTADLYAQAELTENSPALNEDANSTRDEFLQQIDDWGQSLLMATWAACGEPGGGQCPTLEPLSDSSVGDLPPLPSRIAMERTISMILFLHIATTKQYSARTRAFLSLFASLDEDNVVATLKNPDSSMKEAEQQVKDTQEKHAERGKTFRMAGMGLSAVAGGVLVGVTGGLAAPLVGAGVSAIFGIFGVGGTAIGLLASGLASSSVICGALFGAYGAKHTAEMVGRHTREIRDLAIVPVHPSKETLALRLCISGWLSVPEDVTAPWTVFEGDDTYALQWEVQALTELSNALSTLIKAQAMQYVKAEIIKHTVLASLMSSLAPIAWLKIGKIVDNPWMNSRALALKAGAVLADLLSERAFGTRPITLTGYSLGSLVIFEALRCLSELPPAQTVHLVQDVFLFGAPIAPDAGAWTAVRRVVAGRLVNGYGADDYVLAVLCRMSDASWNVAGISPVQVKGVENVECSGVDGHLKWRGMVGECLLACEAPGVSSSEVEKQREIARVIAKEMKMDGKQVEKVIREGPVGSQSP